RDGPTRKGPWLRGGPWQMTGWLAALVYNAVADLAGGLAGEFGGCHVRTLRRRFFNRPGQLYPTPEALIVSLDPFGGQEALVPVIDQFTSARHRLAWVGERRLVPFPS